MGSSIDSGYYLDQQERIRNNECIKSTEGKHEWITYSKGQPSEWYKCKHCGVNIYNK